MKTERLRFTLILLVVAIVADSVVASTLPIANEETDTGSIGNGTADIGTASPQSSRAWFPNFNMQQLNRNYQECIAPGGRKGHCKHLHNCVLSVFKEAFMSFLDYMCIIEKSAIGVCCPDQETERAGPQFVSRLPETGANNNDNGIMNMANNVAADNVADQTRTETDDQHPEDRGCGLATKQFPKISGGRPADPGEWPWMAALLSRGATKAFCGGVLITDRHVLTAAHCTIKFKPTTLFVRLGEYDFERFNETRARDFRAMDIREHEEFDATTYENDIAVVKLHRPSLFNSYIWPICMPPLDEKWEGYQAIVTGWGTQSFGGPNSPILMEVSVPVWRHRECQSAFVNHIDDKMLCAGAYEGGRDSCQGDSGGPLLAQLPNKRWVTIGVVSWGVRCGEANHPGIYTRVSTYIPWIIQNSVF